jgi:tetratricopeptide (TPR) repeat protein
MRHSHESSISAMSLTLVGVIACSVFVLAGAPELKSLLKSAELTPQSRGLATTDGEFSAAPGIPGADRCIEARDGTPRVIELMPSPAQEGPPADERMAEIDMRFQQAVVMLHAQRFDDAMVALHRVLQLSPRLPEAHANMGYALLGLEDHRGAHDFFMTATDLDPYLGSAYWGLAVTLEKLGDLEGALGAMRIYIHLAPPDDPFVRRARSALWEWDTQLARGPLPEHEAEWIERNTREWVERNLPDRDGADQGEVTIPVRDIR